MLMVKIILGLIFIGVVFQVFFLMKNREIRDKRERIKNEILRRIQKKSGVTFYNFDGSTEYDIQFEVIEREICDPKIGEFVKVVRIPILRAGRELKSVYSEFGDYIGCETQWEKKYTKEGVEIPKSGGYMGVDWEKL